LISVLLVVAAWHVDAARAAGPLQESTITLVGRGSAFGTFGILFVSLQAQARAPDSPVLVAWDTDHDGTIDTPWTPDQSSIGLEKGFNFCRNSGDVVGFAIAHAMTPTEDTQITVKVFQRGFCG
jgi:hypothetical protein